MMSIKKTLIGLFVLIFMVQLVSAAEVCVVIDYGTAGKNPDGDCIDIDEGKNGKDVLEAMNLDLLWTPESIWGQMVCKINDVGTDLDGTTCYYDLVKQEFWNFALVDGDEWGHSPVGLNGGDECWNRDFSWSDWSKVVHYCVKDGDVLAFVFGPGGVEPDTFNVNVSKIYVDGEKQKESKTRGGKIIDVFPESVVEIKLELENLYDSKTNIEITDISIEGAIGEIDDGSDIESEINEFDLAADKEVTKELKFTIPLEVEAKDRLLVIDISAEDDAGIKYSKEITFDVEVEKKDHDLRITSAKLNKESYDCGTNALLSLSALNIGEKDEDARFRIVNSDLGIDITKSFELSNDAFEDSSKFDNRFNLDIPKGIDKGSYPISVVLGYGSEEKETTVDLVVNGCDVVISDVKEVKATEEKSEVTDVKVKEDSTDGFTDTDVEKEVIDEGALSLVEESGGKVDLMLGVILGILIVVIVGLFVMFFVFRK